MENKNEFKPYIPAEKITPELTVTSIIMGIILAVVFGAANAYLGLRVGMTVSASIPAAVIAMGVIRPGKRQRSREIFTRIDVEFCLGIRILCNGISDGCRAASGECQRRSSFRIGN